MLVAVVFDAASQSMKLNVYGKADASAPVTADLNSIAWDGTLPVYTDWPLILGSPRKVVSEVPFAQFDDLRIYQRVIGDAEARLLADPTNPAHEQNQDWDNDGLTTAEESLRQTNPRNPDTDGDGLTDGEEIHQHHTEPRLTDSDGDGLGDYAELHPQAPRPVTRPDQSDTDGDGLWDGEELTVYLTDPTDPDTDQDGMPDGWEVYYGLNPKDASDAALDPDQDGFTNLQEYSNMLNYVPGLLPGETPWRPNVNDRYSTVTDSDGDGLSDFDEVIRYKTNPNSTDTIGDGLGDAYRVRTGLLRPNGTVPPGGGANEDFDGDGINNREEKNAGTDASDALNQSVHISGAQPITEIPKVKLPPSAPEPTETLGEGTVTIKKSPTMRVTIQESEESPKFWLVGRIELSDPANPSLPAQKIAVNGTSDPQPERNLGKAAQSVHRFGGALDVTAFANQITPDSAGFIRMKVKAEIIKERIYVPEPTPTPTPTPVPTPTPTPGGGGGGGGGGDGGGGGFGGWVGLGGFWYYAYGAYQPTPPGEEFVNTYSSSDVVVVASGVDLDIKMSGTADYLSEEMEDSPGVILNPGTEGGSPPAEATLLARATLTAQTHRLTWDNQQLTVKTGGAEVQSPYGWDGSQKGFQVSAKPGFAGSSIVLAAFNAQNHSLGSDAVNLLPVKTVTINTFIPQNNVEDPRPFNGTLFKGDNRHGGSPDRATWNENGSHRTQQKFQVIADQALDANGLVDNAYGANADGSGNNDRYVHIGETKSFDPDTSVDSSGNLTAAALADATAGSPLMIGTATAPQNELWIESTTYIGPKKLAIKCRCEGANPLITVGPVPTISYTITITIDKGAGTYSITGIHDGFPAYEIYINGTRAYQHDPLATGDGPGSLFGDGEYDINEIGKPLP